MPRKEWLPMILHSRSGIRGAFIAIGLALVAGAIFSTAGRAAAEVTCPDTIAVAQNAAAAGELQVRDSGKKPELERVTIYEGPPEHQALGTLRNPAASARALAPYLFRFCWERIFSRDRSKEG
jgi:hypothetical protein